MPKKISRDVCLIKYRHFPLWEVDERTDEEFSFYPEFNSQYWIKLDFQSEKNMAKDLSKELKNLYNFLNINELIFFSAHSMKWIAEYHSKRKDDKDLINAISYFEENKLAGNFNGGIEVKTNELEEFLIHFIVLTQCDSGFFHNHILDKSQEILSYIHYTGKVCIETLTKEMNEMFLKEIKRTKFLDAGRENRI